MALEGVCLHAFILKAPFPNRTGLVMCPPNVIPSMDSECTWCGFQWNIHLIAVQYNASGYGFCQSALGAGHVPLNALPCRYTIRMQPQSWDAHLFELLCICVEMFSVSVPHCQLTALLGAHHSACIALKA